MGSSPDAFRARAEWFGARPGAEALSPREIRPLLAPVAAVAALGVAAWLAIAAHEHNGLSRVDPVAATDVLRLRTSWLTDLAQVLSLVGGEVVVGALAVLVFILLLARQRFVHATTFAMCIGGSAFLTIAVKLLVQRARPGPAFRLGAFDASYSFPSGHTLNSAVFLALIVWLLWPAASAAARGALVVAAAALALGVGASRVYLGYHWLTDVVASGLIAVAWCSVVWLLRGQIEHAVTTWVLPVLGRPRTVAARPAQPDRPSDRI